MGGPFFNCFCDSLVCNSVLTKNIFENEYFCQFLASSAKQTKNNFTVRKSYKTRKSTKNRLSNFGLIEETMDLSRILLAVSNSDKYGERKERSENY